MPSDLLMDDPKSEQNESMTPEERLFKVIASGGVPPGAQAPLGQKGKPMREWLRNSPQFVSVQVLRFFKMPLWKEIPKKLSSLFEKSKEKKSFSIKDVNKGLVTIVILAAIYFLADLLVQRTNQLSISGGEPGLMRIYPATVPESSKSVSYYLEPVSKRNVFLPHGEKSASPEDVSVSAVEEKGFKLVGISWDDQGYVAMIEIPGDASAHFVRKGDSLSKGSKIKEVKQYSVIITSGKREWELT